MAAIGCDWHMVSDALSAKGDTSLAPALGWLTVKSVNKPAAAEEDTLMGTSVTQPEPWFPQDLT
jgi:hypothetical protein